MHSDAGTLLEASVVFSLFAFAPGYLAGWLGNVCEFRAATLLRRIALSIPLSIGVVPILAYLPWRFASVKLVWWIFGIVWAGFLVVAASRAKPKLPAKEQRPLWITGFIALAIWIAIALASLPDLQLGHRRYSSVTAYDYLSRVPIASQLSRQAKLPAQSPFLNPGHPVGLRYHYYWPMVCGLVTAVGGGHAYHARDAVIAGTLWVGAGLIAILALYLRLFQGSDGRRWTPYAIAFGLFGVTGLDIIPDLQYDLSRLDRPLHFLPSGEWWNEQIVGWIASALWVPHHVGALIAGLLAFLLLWRGGKTSWIIAAICLASAAGMSIYVTFVFGIALALWALWTIEPLRVTIAAGVLSLLLAAPFLLEMHAVGQAGDPTSQKTNTVLRFTVRNFEWMPDLLGPFQLAGLPSGPASLFWRIVFLPINYFLELGVYFVAGIIYWRRRRRDSFVRDRSALLLLATSVILCTFVASSVGLNDLGWRGFMPAQFILLLWTTSLLSAQDSPLRPVQFRWLALLMILGVTSTLFDLVSLRFYLPFVDSAIFNRMANTPGVDRRMGELHTAQFDTAAWVRDHTQPSAVVQTNPQRVSFAWGLAGDRAALATGKECSIYSGLYIECAALMRDMDGLFKASPASLGFAEVCRKYPVDVFIVDADDGVWPDKKSWIWNTSPIYSTEFTRAFACHP